MVRPRSDIRPRLLAAARERFLYEGVDGASLRQIASEAGTNIGMVYYYFPAKDDLFFAAIEDVYIGLLADLERMLDPGRPFAESIRMASQRIGEMSDSENVVVRLVIREMLISTTRREKLLQRFSSGHIGLLMRVVAAAYQRGEIRSDVPPLLAMLTLGAGTLAPQFIARAVSATVTFPLPDAATLAAGLLNNALQGLAPRASDPTPTAEGTTAATKPAAAKRKARR